MPEKLTEPQKRALRLLDGHTGVMSSGATTAFDGQPWIHYRTAIRLWRRSLLDVEGWDRDDGLDLEDQPETDGLLTLTDRGREVLRDA